MQVAVKFDFEPSPPSGGILGECLYLRNNKHSMSVQYILHDTVKGRRFLITNYLENSVIDYLEKFKGKMFLDKLQDLAIQMLEAVE
jgi:hypothetical protein